MGNCCSGGDESKKATAFVTNNDSESFQVVGGSGGGADSSGALSATIDGGGLDSNQSNNNVLIGAGMSSQDGIQQQQLLQQQQGIGDGDNNNNNEAQIKAMREEQNRLDLIVQMAGRGMVSVRSTRGSTGYYDQGFAAALGQHLQQTTKFPDKLPIRLPSITYNENNSTSSSSGEKKNTTSKNTLKENGTSTATTTTTTTTVTQRLSQPQWDNIALGKKGIGLAGCDGENPNTYMDHVAVSFLDEVIPKKERIFHGGRVGPMVENLL